LVEQIKKPAMKLDDGSRGDYYPKKAYYQLTEKGKNISWKTIN